MQFSTSKENILPALQMLNGVVERKQTLPILSHILFQLENNTLTLTGSDLEMELQASIAVETAEAGEVTVSAQKIFDICRALPEEAQLQFSKVSDGKVEVLSGKSKFSLSTLNAAEFPRMEHPENPEQFEISQQGLLALLQQTHFSMAHQDVRYYLNGMLLELEGNAVTVVATDGHRLATSSGEVNASFTEKTQVILPRKAVLELKNLLDDVDEKISVGVTSNQMLLLSENLSLVVRLIDGRYPDYEKVIPKDGDKVFLVEREKMRQVLQRAAILSNEKYRGIRLIFKDNTIHVYANNSDKEEAQDEIQIDYTGEPLEIGFNVSYLLDAIQAVESEMVQITAKGANDSCLVQNQAQENPVYVVMPMRL